jgi:hypothetical protein
MKWTKAKLAPRRSRRTPERESFLAVIFDATRLSDGRFTSDVPALEELRVLYAMHPGLISCPLDVPLRTVARMATYRVHAILVTAHGEEALRRWPVGHCLRRRPHPRSRGWRPRRAAGAVDRDHAVRRSPSDELSRAAKLMVERDVSHLIVVERHWGGRSACSTLDVARALAGFPSAIR